MVANDNETAENKNEMKKGDNEEIKA